MAFQKIVQQTDIRLLGHCCHTSVAETPSVAAQLQHLLLHLFLSHLLQLLLCPSGALFADVAVASILHNALLKRLN